MPNAALFPFSSISFKIGEETLETSGKELIDALQYSPTPGLNDLVNRVSQLQQIEHTPPNPFSLVVVPGSQDGLAKIFDMLIEEGDSMLVEAPTYSGSLAYLEAKGCNLVGVSTDGTGLNPDALALILDSWNTTTQGPKPKVLYTIPTVI